MSRLNPQAGSKMGAGCLLFFAILWLGFSLTWTFLAFQSGEGWQWLFGIPFILIGLFLLSQFVIRLMARARVARPDLDISNPSPRIGETFTVHHRQAFKTTAQVERIAVELVFHESATYRRGTDTYTKTHEQIVDYIDHPARHFEAGETFQDHYQFTIPPDGMHSFSGNNNKLTWFIRITVDIANWPTYVEEFPIDVRAERGW